MTNQYTHLHIATTTGLPHWAIIFHATAGTVGLITGFLSLGVAKGSRVHKVAGMIFTYAMMSMGFLAVGIGAYEGKPGFIDGFFVVYLIFTAMTTVRPVAINRPGLGVALAAFALFFGVSAIMKGFVVMGVPGGVQDGVPFGMLFFLGTIAVLAGVGDLRMIRAGGWKGTQRIARHLWRMCFGLFVASGSFFLGQMKFFPKPLRSPALMMLPAVLPLIALLYWMWRVRIRQSLRGLVTAVVPAPSAVGQAE
jgi:hypothetical protein